MVAILKSIFKTTPCVWFCFFGMITPGTWLKADSKLIQAEYEKRAKVLGSGRADAHDHYRLGQWCQEQGLKDEARLQFSQSLLYDGDFELAWQALGYEKVDGIWMTSSEHKQVQGLVLYKRRWVPETEWDAMVMRDALRQAGSVKRSEQVAAAATITRMARPEFHDLYIESLRSRKPAVVNAALNAILKAKDQQSFPAVLKLYLEHRDDRVRSESEFVLLALSPQKFSQVLIDRLPIDKSLTDLGKTKSLMQSLSMSELKSSQSHLLKLALVSGDFDIRELAQQNLLERKVEWSFKQLLALLFHRDSLVRARVSQLLGAWGNMKAFPHLLLSYIKQFEVAVSQDHIKRLQKDSQPSEELWPLGSDHRQVLGDVVRADILPAQIRALQSLTGLRYGKDVQRWMQWWREQGGN